MKALPWHADSDGTAWPIPGTSMTIEEAAAMLPLPCDLDIVNLNGWDGICGRERGHEGPCRDVWEVNGLDRQRVRGMVAALEGDLNHWSGWKGDQNG